MSELFHSETVPNHPVCEDHQSSFHHTSAIGCIIPSLTQTYEPPSPQLALDTSSCPYFNEQYTHVDCAISGEIQVLALDLIKPSDVVLEIGSRYGTVSCAVALAQNNSGRLIAVEADPDVWAIHQVGGEVALVSLTGSSCSTTS